MKCPECGGPLICSKIFKTDKYNHYLCPRCEIVYDSRQTLKVKLLGGTEAR